MGVYTRNNIITNGLVLCLDAANKMSYAGSGTSWNDLSGNNNTGTLTNGPTFSSNDGSSLLFDGVDDYISCGNSNSVKITQGTISAWIKTSNAGSSFRGIIVKQHSYNLFLLDNILITFDFGNFVSRSTGINVADNSWTNVVMSFTETTGTPSNNATLYINGKNVLLTTAKYSKDTVELQIGRGGTDPGGEAQLFTGNINLCTIYNRALSSSEIIQNYNATKTRFGMN